MGLRRRPRAARHARRDLDIAVAADGTATTEITHTVTGSCLGPGMGRKTSPMTVTGERTDSGFEFPSDPWGTSGSFTIDVSGDQGQGTLSGPGQPGVGRITIDFDVHCVNC